MLPRRHKDGKTVRIRLTVPWFFSDRVISLVRYWLLRWVRGQRYSTMEFPLSSVLPPLSMNLHTDNGLVFFFPFYNSPFTAGSGVVPADQAASQASHRNGPTTRFQCDRARMRRKACVTWSKCWTNRPQDQLLPRRTLRLPHAPLLSSRVGRATSNSCTCNAEVNGTLSRLKMQVCTYV
jgi:hypothetical protein